MVCRKQLSNSIYLVFQIEFKAQSADQNKLGPKESFNPIYQVLIEVNVNIQVHEHYNTRKKKEENLSSE